MTARDEIEKAISRTTKFEPGYPRRIVTGNEKADAFFAWEYEEAMKRAVQLEEMGVYNSNEGQMNML